MVPTVADCANERHPWGVSSRMRRGPEGENRRGHRLGLAAVRSGAGVVSAEKDGSG